MANRSAAPTPAPPAWPSPTRRARRSNSTGATTTYTGLQLTGTVRAGAGTDPLTATAPNSRDLSITTTGTLSLNGTLAGKTVTLNAGAITETGSIVASTLTGAAGSATMDGTDQVATLGAFTASTGTLSLTDDRSLAVTAPLAAPNGDVALTIRTGTLSLALLPNAAPTIAARNIRLSAAGDIGVDGLLSASSGTMALSSTGGAIQINPTAILGAQTSLALAAQNGVAVAGGTVHAPTVTIGNTLANQRQRLRRQRHPDRPRLGDRRPAARQHPQHQRPDLQRRRPLRRQ